MQEPKTIEELKQWYVAHNLPDETITRFFIGKNYQEPKAFGIYQEATTGEFVIYKNKADGTRAERYRGKDEAYAVAELWLKLKEEILHQKQFGRSGRKSIQGLDILSLIVFFGFMLPLIIGFFYRQEVIIDMKETIIIIKEFLGISMRIMKVGVRFRHQNS